MSFPDVVVPAPPAEVPSKENCGNGQWLVRMGPPGSYARVVARVFDEQTLAVLMAALKGGVAISPITLPKALPAPKLVESLPPLKTLDEAFKWPNAGQKKVKTHRKAHPTCKPKKTTTSSSSLSASPPSLRSQASSSTKPPSKGSNKRLSTVLSKAKGPIKR